MICPTKNDNPLVSLRDAHVYLLAPDSSSTVERTAHLTRAADHDESKAACLSPVGKRLLHRCLVEAETRFCHVRAAAGRDDSGFRRETGMLDTDIPAIVLSCDYGNDTPVDLPGRDALRWCVSIFPPCAYCLRLWHQLLGGMRDGLFQCASETPSAEHPPPVYSKHNVFALLLDLRLCASKRVADMLLNQVEVFEALADKYVEFAMAAKKHDEDVAARDSVLHTTTSPVQASCTPSTPSVSVQKWSAKQSIYGPKNASSTQAGNDTEIAMRAYRIDFKYYYGKWHQLGETVLESAVRFAQGRIKTCQANSLDYCHGIPAHEKHGTGMLREMMAFDVGEHCATASSTLFGFLPRMAYCYMGGCLSHVFTSQALSDATEIARMMARTGFDSDTLRKQVILRQNRDFVRAWTHAGDTQGSRSDNSTDALSSAHAGPAGVPSSAIGSG